MTCSTHDRRERALALLARLDPQAPGKVAANLDALSADFAERVLGFAFADVLARPGLDLRTREMLTVAALMAMGAAPGQLEFHLRAALNVGVSREEIIEILLQVAVYAGVPACMNGVSAARLAFAAHPTASPDDAHPPVASTPDRLRVTPSHGPWRAARGGVGSGSFRA